MNSNSYYSQTVSIEQQSLKFKDMVVKKVQYLFSEDNLRENQELNKLILKNAKGYIHIKHIMNIQYINSMFLSSQITSYQKASIILKIISAQSQQLKVNKAAIRRIKQQQNFLKNVQPVYAEGLKQSNINEIENFIRQAINCRLIKMECLGNKEDGRYFIRTDQNWKLYQLDGAEWKQQYQIRIFPIDQYKQQHLIIDLMNVNQQQQIVSKQRNIQENKKALLNEQMQLRRYQQYD